MSKQNGGIIGPNNIPTGPFGSASGVWKLSDVINYKKQETWPVVLNNFQVDNSCRFNGNDEYLSKTVGNAVVTNATFSCWFKRSVIGANQTIYATDSSNEVRIKIHSDDKLDIYSYTSSYQYRLQTNRLFRDPSAWYHLVIRVDTTNGTADNRIRVYINGTQETSFAARTNPGTNDNIEWFQGVTGYIGISENGSSNPFGGYLAEVVMVDGTTYESTSFGEFDSQTGIWVPKIVTGLTFGTNGWYLPFTNASALGEDFSGEDNDFTVSNLTSIDQSIDSCTNNFANLNALSKGSNIALSNSNLSASNGNTDNSVLGNMAFANGKWYWEAKCTGATTYATIGITLASVDGSVHSAVDAGRVVYSSTGYIYREGLSGQGNISGVATFTTNDIVGIAFNAQNGSVAFYKNGVLINTTVDSQLLYTNNQYINSVGLNQGSFDFNFGSPTYAISSGNVDSSGLGNFEYAVPEGFYSLCTKNLNLIG
jgi:hypothetical protein